MNADQPPTGSLIELLGAAVKHQLIEIGYAYIQ
jgi:hypothetical protein